MPKILYTAKDGKIPLKDQYTAGDIAFLMGVAHRTACKFIDEGTISGFRLPVVPGNRMRERRVHHNALLKFVKDYPEYEYMLKKLDGYVPEEPLAKPEPDPEVQKCKIKERLKRFKGKPESASS